MFDGFTQLLQWHLSLFLLGILFLPLAFILFPKFIDRGYIFAKILAIIFLTYTSLFFGTLHILPFGTLSLLFLLSCLFIAQIFFFLKTKNQRDIFKESLKNVFIFIVIEEILFFIILLFWSYIRSISPDINGLEKYMDFGFVNSILRSTYFPPKDMWLTPEPINYYYFGHMATAVLTKISFLPSSITYNLMMATLAALTFVASFSIGINLIWKYVRGKLLPIRIFFIGIIAALLVSFSGNLHTLYTLFLPYENENPQPFWELVFSPQTFPNSYWYPNATRFIHNTIHEFPLYSWTVSDLHGHVLDIPFVLLTIALLYSILQQFSHLKKASTSLNSSQTFVNKIALITTYLPIPLPYVILSSFILSVLYMTNAWDGLIYFLLTHLILFYLIILNSRKNKIPLLKKVFNVLSQIIPSFAILFFGFILFSLPLSLFFKPFVSGIGILCAPDFLTSLGSIGPLLFEPDHCQRSPLWQLLLLHGFFFIYILIFLFFTFKNKKNELSDYFVLLLILLSLVLILIPEFIYAKDIYPAHYRANTMFKLVFQAFIMLSLSTAYIIPRVAQYLRESEKRSSFILYLIFAPLTVILLTIVLSYPYFAINSYYSNVFAFGSNTPPESKGLNGIRYLEKYPDDYKALLWIEQNIQGQPIILEAQGDSYTEYSRISSNTGIPTVLGWTVHEWLWRGSYDIPAPRIEDVKIMYETADDSLRRTLFDKYNITYVFIGELENEKYTVSDKLTLQTTNVIFRSGDTKILKIK